MAHQQSSGQGRQILSEEEYTQTLTSIIKRDYFPDINNLERQAALLERRAQGDVAGAVAIRRATRRLQEHEEALAEAENEDEHDLDERSVRRIARPLHQESISGFHARVTNEDDAEFEAIQNKEIKDNRERLAKLFRPPEAAVPLLTNMASDQFQAEPNRITASEWKAPAARNGLFFSPTPVRKNPENAGSSQLLLTNGADETQQSSQFALMPPPQNVSTKLSISVPKHQLVEYVPKHALEKRIEPSQTRFPDKIIPHPSNIGRGLVPESDLESETDGSVTDASTDLDAPLRPLDDERRRKQNRQEKNRGAYVAMTPLIVPGETGNESPITTWGTVDSTPLTLSGQEAEGGAREAQFGIAGDSSREKAARKAEEKLAHRAKRAKSNKPKRMHKVERVVGTTSLTPAALSLWQRTSQNVRSRSSDSFASSLRSSYTPKLRSKSSVNSGKSSKSRAVRDTAYNATPIASKK